STLKRLVFPLLALAVAIGGLLFASSSDPNFSPPERSFMSRAAVAFDASPPLASMDQFIPGKEVVIHHATDSVPVRKGDTRSAALGQSAPIPPAPRPGGGA